MRMSDYLALVMRSLRRSRLRSGLTISAIVIGATGITIMLTFVTSVKNDVVNQFVQSGQIDQIQVSQTPNLTYNPSGSANGGGPPPPGSTALLTAGLEAKIATLPHVTAVAATLGGGGPIQSLQYLYFGGRKVSINNMTAYQANGVIKPTLLAGRNIGPGDNANVIVLSQDYANALGFKGDYAKLIGLHVAFHTAKGYTGAGARLPTDLPPQNQCQPNNLVPGAVCGPTSGLPSVNLPATVIGVVSSSFARQTIFLPLSWAVGIANPS